MQRELDSFVKEVIGTDFNIRNRPYVESFEQIYKSDIEKINEAIIGTGKRID